MKVNDILRKKGTRIFSISPMTSVFDALKLMAEKNLGGLLVMENDRLVGIFTERDYARKIILLGRASKDTMVREVMSVELRTVTKETDIMECMQIMTNKTIRHLPVMEEENLIGIISIGDVVKFIIEEQQGIIEHLESYISR
jgi:CBS domain-containing protein